MHDTILFESDVVSRRNSIVAAASVSAAVETLWCRAGGCVTGMDQPTYSSFHQHIVAFLFPKAPPNEHGLEADWKYDSTDGFVGYESWCLSVLELADNWCQATQPEAFASFISLLATHLPTEQRESQNVVRPIGHRQIARAALNNDLCHVVVLRDGRFARLSEDTL